MNRCFGYIRVSSRNQLNGDGPERQETAIRQYADGHGYEIETIWRDSVTGTTETRDGFAKMLLALEENGLGIKTILIEKLDRLARDLIVSEAMIRDIKKLNVQLISVWEGPDLLSNDPSRKLIRHLFEAVAEYDKCNLVMRLRVARERKRAKGEKVEGQKGYPAALRLRIGQLALNGTHQTVAEQLNLQGEKTLR